MALDSDRNTPMIGTGLMRVFDVAASQKIFAGSIVALQNGLAIAAKETTGLICVGRALESVDNSNGADGEKSIAVDRGIFKFNNSSGTDKITKADIGSDCYVVDDETVAKTDNSGARSVAGRVFDVEDDGVWVEFYK